MAASQVGRNALIRLIRVERELRVFSVEFGILIKYVISWVLNCTVVLCDYITSHVFYEFWQLLTQFGCEDQPMVDHVTELLASLPEDPNENQDEENGGVDDNSEPADSDEEEMDTQ